MSVIRFTFNSTHSKIFKFQKCLLKRGNIFINFSPQMNIRYSVAHINQYPSSRFVPLFLKNIRFFLPFALHSLEKHQVKYLWCFIVHILRKTKKGYLSSVLLQHLLRFVRFHFCSHQSMRLLIFQSCVPLAMDKFHTYYCREENGK